MAKNSNIDQQGKSVETEQLREAIQKLMQENQQLRQAWVVQRAQFLFKVVENDIFSAKTKNKAKAELENFLFPKEETQADKQK